MLGLGRDDEMLVGLRRGLWIYHCEGGERDLYTLAGLNFFRGKGPVYLVGGVRLYSYSVETNMTHWAMQDEGISELFYLVVTKHPITPIPSNVRP